MALRSGRIWTARSPIQIPPLYGKLFWLFRELGVIRNKHCYFRYSKRGARNTSDLGQTVVPSHPICRISKERSASIALFCRTAH